MYKCCGKIETEVVLSKHSQINLVRCSKCGSTRVIAIHPKTKSEAASRVLRLMDSDCSYQVALHQAVKEYRIENIKKLEEELSIYC